MEQRDVIVIGAGLAGLTAALELSRRGFRVLVFEKHRLPRHKVCGEYLSREVVPYLEASGIRLEDAPRIDTFVLGGHRGRTATSKLPLGGIGISRYALDFRLYEQAKKHGADFIWEPVEAVFFEQGIFRVSCRGKEFHARQVLGAWGKRSNLDRVLGRPFFSGSTPWMAIKMHYRAEYPAGQVGLYNFRGGYGGLSVTETGAVNFCYLIHRDRFRSTPDVYSCTSKLLSEHPSLDKVLHEAEPLFEAAMSISNIAFDKKQMIWDHLLLSGDAAQLIHPLSGNGMAMAIQSGRMQSHFVSRFLDGSLPDRAAMERGYESAWKEQFRSRLRMGRALQQLLLHPAGSAMGLQVACMVPGLLPGVIRRTHGSL